MGRVMSYEDIMDAQKKRDEKDAVRQGVRGGSERTPPSRLRPGEGRSHVMLKPKRPEKKSKHWEWKAFVLYLSNGGCV
jgi:hypothetical protein